MKTLRKTIRKIILEDLGEKLFARQAPPGHAHHGNEQNTEEEEKFMDELWSYIIYNDDSTIESDFGERYAEYAEDPRYADVLKVVPPGITLYRGMSVPKQQLEGQIFEMDDITDMPVDEATPDSVYTNLADSEYEHLDWRNEAKHMLSSWTTDINTAIGFASGGETKQDTADGIPAVFIAETGGSNTGKFLDFRNLYDYKRLEPKRNEQEVIGWGMIELSKIYVGDF
jgi:hypothetical protein